MALNDLASGTWRTAVLFPAALVSSARRPRRDRWERRERLERRLDLSRDASGSEGRAVSTFWRRARVGAGCKLDHTLAVWAMSVLHPMERIDTVRVAQETEAALELWEREGWLTQPESYHRRPPPLRDPVIEPARARGLHFERARYASEFEPHPDSPGRDRWLGYARNRCAWAWLLRHPGAPRPWVVCIHGTGMGTPRLDFTAFAARWLHERLGLNVAFPVLPLSGPRREEAFGIQFPTNDTLDNVHGLSQSLWDIRRLIDWLRSQGAEQIALQGISLGGYTAALYAAFDDQLDCVIAGVPATDFSNLFEHHLSSDFRARNATLLDGARRLHGVVSPLSFPARVPRERRFIYGGIADRITHPIHQVQRLWEHWSRPVIRWYDVPHVGLFWSGAIRDFVGQALARSGIVPVGRVGGLRELPALREAPECSE